jgi:hypothetical protein
LLKKFITTINRSIFVGERLERNIQNLLAESYIFIVLGAVIALLNLVNGDYRIVFLAVLFVAAGFVDVYYLKVKRSREFSFVLTCIASVLVLTYCVLVVHNGFAYLWTLLIPLSCCYLYGVREGLCLTAYFQILFIVAFYTPVRSYLEGYYLPIVMERFPILYFLMH